MRRQTDHSPTLTRPEPGLRRVLAPNPSPMTERGTNTFLVGEGEVAVIDPGPADPAHMRAILAALAPGERISHILVTHAHLDHSALAPALARATGAPVLAFGAATAGRSATMKTLAAAGLTAGGEGMDAAFAPDETVADGQEISHGDWSLRAIWTPGHFGNHLCFAWNGAIFTGDHVMGWAPTFISPPDGDVADFIASADRLASLGARVFYPAHGAPVNRPDERARWLIAHRLEREAQIVEALGDGPADLHMLARRVYHDIPASMMPAARRNLFAHLVDLVQKSRVGAEPELSPRARFRLI